MISQKINCLKNKNIHDVKTSFKQKQKQTKYFFFYKHGSANFEYI